MNEASAVAVTYAIETLCLEHGRPRLIVIDTFARNMGDGDENSNADVGVFINRIDNMRAQLGCAILIVHHVGHSATDRARGASSLHAAMDTVFRLDKSRSGMTMIHIKAKESEPNLPLGLGLEQVPLTGWLDAEGEEMNSAVIVAGAADATAVSHLTPSQEKALDLFREVATAHGEFAADGSTVGLHVEYWRVEYQRQSNAATANAKRVAFQRIRDKLVSLGRLSVNGDHYCLSGPAGLAENFQLRAAIRARTGAGTPAQ